MLKTYWKIFGLGVLILIVLGFYFNFLSFGSIKNLGGQVFSSFFGDSNNFKELDRITLDSSKIEDNQEALSTPIEKCSFDEARVSNTRKIIFNEIAWMGSSNSSNDEWIELKNISNGEINLLGYQILSQDGDIEIVFDEKDKIFSNNFYLLERTDDNSTNEPADKIYVGSLANYSEGIRLFDRNCNLLDEVFANPGWPAGDNSTKKTMERRSNLSWQISSVKDGTPRKDNSIGETTVSNKNINDSDLDLFSSSTNNLSVTSSSSGSFSAPTVCSQDNLGSPIHSVLINEVAWAGTNSDKTTKEWIELKNNSGVNINLNNWQILNKNSSIKIFFDSSNNLVASGYYLLERVNDDSVPGITADKIFTNSIKNNDESLRLFDNSCRLIDEILANPDWPAGTASPDYHSMERGSNLNWHSYSGSGSNGIFGTPKSQNSISPQPSIQPQLSDFLASPQYFTVSINKIGDGTGVIMSVPSGIDCGNSCLEGSADFLKNTSLIISATSSPDSSFSGWSGACSGLESCNLTINNNVSVTANFIKNQSQPSSEPIQLIKRILISEVMVGKIDNADYEFVEIYNAGAGDVDLTGWSIKKRSSTGSESPFVAASRLEEKTIPAGKHFLIVHDVAYNGAVLADAIWPVSYSLAYTNNAVLLYNDNGEKIEEVSWTEILKDQSYERISWDTSVFQNQLSPNPQNSGI